MAHMTLNSYLQQLEDAVAGRDGVTAAEFLSFKNPHIANRQLQLDKPEAKCERWFSPPWDEMVAAHLRCCYAVANHDFIEAFACQSVVVQAFTKALQAQKEENWSLPIMFAITVDLRCFAYSADIQMTKRGRGKPGDTVEKAAEILMGCFRVCASDNRAAPEDSKKWGMLNLVNQLFKTYFKINKLQLCKPLIRAIESLPIKDKFAISQLITYKYYTGRKALFDNDFKSAEDMLMFAFERCHIQARRNKRLILIYLIPVKMLLGHMPSTQLLKKHNLLQFSDVAKSVSCGNLLKFNEAMATHESFFIKCGIYLILEQLKILTYRNLFKKVYLLMGTHQLPIRVFTTALTMMGETDVDDDEVECIISNLIYENKIKGYISHAHQKLVVSKQNAFPLGGS